MKTIKFLKTNEKAKLPTYAHDLDAGMDIYSIQDDTLLPGEFKVIPTGLKCQMPDDFEMQIRPRSGLAAKNGVTVLNTPGTVDAGYRGEVGVILINLSKVTFEITEGMRIAQMVFAPVSKVKTELVTELSDSQRGKGGFGSSGVK